MTTNRASKPACVNAAGAELKCNGNPAGGSECADAVKSGAKVQVRGTLSKGGQGSAEVTASQVKVQKTA